MDFQGLQGPYGSRRSNSGFTTLLHFSYTTPVMSLRCNPEGNQDVCILRIKGGPPYEDIAFKVREG